jgi:hypothetical protein
MTKKHFKVFHKKKKMKPTSRSLARIYLPKQDKVERNRKGKIEHFCLTYRKWEQRGSKLVSLGLVYRNLPRWGIPS